MYLTIVKEYNTKEYYFNPVYVYFTNNMYYIVNKNNIVEYIKNSEWLNSFNNLNKEINQLNIWVFKSIKVGK